MALHKNINYCTCVADVDEKTLRPMMTFHYKVFCNGVYVTDKVFWAMSKRIAQELVEEWNRIAGLPSQSKDFKWEFVLR